MLLTTAPYTTQSTISNPLLLGLRSVVGLACDDGLCDPDVAHSMFIANMVVTVCTVAWLRARVPRVLYTRLVRLIKDKFKSVHAYVGMFEDIDKQI